jgi:hypothetical protein
VIPPASPGSTCRRLVPPGHPAANVAGQGFAARGYLDTHCYVFPGLELVVARMQTRPHLFATEPYEPKALALFKQIVRK